MRTGTNLEDEDVLAKNVMDINGRTVMPFHSLCMYDLPNGICYSTLHVAWLLPLLLEHTQETYVGFQNIRPYQVLSCGHQQWSPNWFACAVL